MKKMPAYVIAAFCGYDERIALVVPIEKWHGVHCTSKADFYIPLTRTGRKNDATLL